MLIAALMICANQIKKIKFIYLFYQHKCSGQLACISTNLMDPEINDHISL